MDKSLEMKNQWFQDFSSIFEKEWNHIKLFDTKKPKAAETDKLSIT